MRWANRRTSSATTANPRPASPARAASMAAFNASRLVCSAMLRITLSTWLISPENPSSWRMCTAVSLITSLMRFISWAMSRINSSLLPERRAECWVMSRDTPT
ncbi:hypothetical protein D3C73_1362060 [compost metagenome]